MVNPKKNFTKDVCVTGGFDDINGFFNRDTQHDTKESRSRRKKSCAALADELADIDQLDEANKSLRAPDLRVRSTQRRKELPSRSKNNAKSNEAPGLLA